MILGGTPLGSSNALLGAAAGSEPIFANATEIVVLSPLREISVSGSSREIKVPVFNYEIIVKR